MVETFCLKYKNKLLGIIGIIGYLSIFIEWCISTRFINNTVWAIPYGVVFVFICIIATIAVYLEKNLYREDNILGQLVIIFILSGLIQCALMTGKLKGEVNIVGLWGVTIVLTQATTIVVTLGLVSRLITNRKDYFISRIKEIIYNTCHNWPVIILILGVCVFSYDSVWKQYKWDGKFYFYMGLDASPYSLSNMGIVGHLCQGYVFIQKLFYYICGDAYRAMLIYNITMLIISIIYFYKLISHILIDSSPITKTLYTSVYAFSPLALGMVNYYSPDFTLMCLLLPTIYYAYTKQWILHFAAAIFMVLTKEPAIIVYAGLCLGVLVSDLRRYRSVKVLFAKCRYIMMIVIAITWIVLYRMIGGWSAGTGGFEIHGDYIWLKLKTMYIFNFTWVFVVGIIALGVFAIIKRKKVDIELLGLLLGILISFTAFSTVYYTANNARYNSIVAPLLSMIFIAVISVLPLVNNKGLVNFIGIILSAIMFMSSYITVDPISYSLFDSVNIGEGCLLSTGEPIIGDTCVYNKQALWLEKAIDEGIAYGIEEGAQIAFCGIPTFYNFDGTTFETVSDGMYQYALEYWSTVDKMRFLVDLGDSIPIKVYLVSSKTEIPSGRVCYIRIPSEPNEVLDELLVNCDLVDMKSFKYRGWIVDAYLFDVS